MKMSQAMRTVVAAALALALVLTMVACGGGGGGATQTDNASATAPGTEELPVLNIGITEYPPLNYYENGKLVGFDTEFAEEVCKELGYRPNFIIIDWGSKELELKAKNIDVVWNGMQWTEERAQNMLLSDQYLSNGGVLVVKKGQTDPAVILSTVAVERGSQAEKTVENDPFFANSELIKVDTMTKGFLEVASGNVTSTYADYIVARGTLGNDYQDLEIWDGFSIFGDHLALGFRQEDTELANKVNGVMAEMKQDGRMKALAEKYGLGDLL